MRENSKIKSLKSYLESCNLHRGPPQSVDDSTGQAFYFSVSAVASDCSHIRALFLVYVPLGLDRPDHRYTLQTVYHLCRGRKLAFPGCSSRIYSSVSPKYSCYPIIDPLLIDTFISFRFGIKN